MKQNTFGDGAVPEGPARETGPEPDTEEVDELVTSLLTASRVLVGVAAGSLAEVEVTVPQFRVLILLDNHAAMNLQRLADLLDVTPSTAMRMVDRLIGADLVTRRGNPDNRREVVLGLTDAGAARVAMVTDRRRAAIATIVARMPVERRSDLVAALRAFADAAGEPPATTTPGGLGW